ncbi:hypothetical protein KCP76_08375 [Salmonella enterica subsp. enterica serovar Weltevreden]|nr:hypothetical protein KCP76_08375 [Salmonella enterica subsp. enterica serovar Weltevreden]
MYPAEDYAMMGIRSVTGSERRGYCGKISRAFRRVTPPVQQCAASE